MIYEMIKVIDYIKRKWKFLLALTVLLFLNYLVWKDIIL